jgi:hypothetical protein
MKTNNDSGEVRILNIKTSYSAICISICYGLVRRQKTLLNVDNANKVGAANQTGGLVALETPQKNIASLPIIVLQEK